MSRTDTPHSRIIWQTASVPARAELSSDSNAFAVYRLPYNADVEALRRAALSVLSGLSDEVEREVRVMSDEQGRPHLHVEAWGHVCDVESLLIVAERIALTHAGKPQPERRAAPDSQPYRDSLVTRANPSDRKILARASETGARALGLRMSGLRSVCGRGENCGRPDRRRRTADVSWPLDLAKRVSKAGALTAWRAFLARVAPDEQGPVGVNAGAIRAGFPGVFACLSWMAPFEAPLSDEETFVDLVRDHEEALRESELRAHASRALQADPSYRPRTGFAVGYTHVRTVETERRLAALGWTLVDAHAQSAPVAVCLSVREGASISARLVFDENALAMSDAKLLARRFSIFLENLATNQHGPLKEVSLFGVHERPARFGPRCRRQTAPDFMAAVLKHIASTPDSPAVREMRHTNSFKMLGELAAGVAEALADAGVAGETPVAIHVPRSTAALASVLACWSSGVPFSFLDVHWPPACKRAILEALQPCAIIRSDSESGGRLAFDVPTVWTERVDTEHPDPTDYLRVPTGRDDAVAYVCFTSGTTGDPKGVAIPRRGLNNYLEWAMRTYAASGKGTSALYSSLAVDFSLTALLVPPMCGATVVACWDGEIDALARLIDNEERFDFLKLTPTGLTALLGVLAEEKVRAAAGLLVLGGEALGPGLRRQLARWHEVIVYDEYGPTETTVGSIARRVTASRSDSQGRIGHPISRTGAWVLDALGRPLPPGIWGQIALTGEGVAKGYWNDTQRTLAAFPLIGRPRGQRCYLTGDLGRIGPNGDFEVRGRIDAQIKHRGFRLEPREISALLERREDVRAAHVAQIRIGDRKALVALALVARPESATPAFDEELRHYIANLVPVYAIPDRVKAVTKFPTAMSGKIDGEALVALFDNSEAPEKRTEGLEGAAETREFAQDTSRFQESDACMLLANAWRKVLGTIDVEPQSDFFALGGDSIKALLVMNEMRQSGWRIAFPDFFRYSKLVQLSRKAEQIAPSNPSERSQPRSGNTLRDLPQRLTDNQRDYLNLVGEFPKDWITAWNGRLVTGDESAHVKDAYHDLLRAHPVLTTPLRGTAERDAPFFEEVTDRVAFAAAEQRARDWIDPEAGRHSALIVHTRGSAAGEARWIVHHAVIDLYSWQRLVSELQARMLGDPPPPAAIPPPCSVNKPFDRSGAWGWQPSSPDFGPARRWRPDRILGLGVACGWTLAEVSALVTAALGRALCLLREWNETIVCAETHGRGGRDDPLAVGWLTGYRFAVLAHPSRQGPAEALALCLDHADVATYQVARHEPAASVNILGQASGTDILGTVDFHPHDDGTVPLRVFQIQLNLIQDGEHLESEWIYGADRFAKEELTTLFDLFSRELTTVARVRAPRSSRLTPTFANVIADLVLGEAVGPPCHLEQVAIDFDGPLSLERFERSCAELAHRHESLRVTFDLSTDPPQARVEDEASPVLEVREVAPGEDIDSVYREESERALSTPFDIGTSPLQRLCLVRLAPTRHRLIWTHHHAIFDGWSQMRLLGELLLLYEGQSLPAAPQPSAYRQWLERSTRSQEVGETSAPASGRVSPISPRRGIPQADRFGTLCVPASRALRRRLERLSRRHGVSVGAVAVAAWCLTAERSPGLNDGRVGVTISGRQTAFEAVDRVVGALAHAVPLGNLTGRRANGIEWVRSVGQRIAELGERTPTGKHGDGIGFSSIVAVANYPASDSVTEGGISAHIDFSSACGGYSPLKVIMTVMLVDRLVFRLSYDRAVLEHFEARETMALFVRTLSAGSARWSQAIPHPPALITDPGARLADEAGLEADADSTEAGGGSASLSHRIAREVSSMLGGRKVGVSDDFFSVGGHSLLGIRLVRWLRAAFGGDIRITDLLEARTPAALAARIEGMVRDGDGEVALSYRRFPLTPLQEAYWIGRSEALELGGVDPHLYAEFDFTGLDVAKAERCILQLIDRHPMLRAVIDEDGWQRMESSVSFRIERIDLRSLSPREAGRRLTSLRYERAHARRPLHVPPLFGVTTIALPGGDRHRVIVSLSLMIGDARSWMILGAEFTALYCGHSLTAAPSVTFADHVATQRAAEGGADYERARMFWQQRIAEIPFGPALPRRASGLRTEAENGLVSRQFTRRTTHLSRSQSKALRRWARSLGVTVSGMLASVFSEILAAYADEPAHLLNFTLFDRPRGFDRVVGDFTAPLLVANPMTGPDFAARIRELQRAIWQAIDYRAYSGVEALRDLARARRGAPSALAPVVFTSTLDFDFFAHDSPLMPPGCDFVWSIGQTPQVSLDCQAYEFEGQIVVNWDSVDSVYADGLIPAMFEAHSAALARIADAPLGVLPDAVIPDSPSPVAEPRRSRDKLLHEDFLKHARRRPRAPAIITDERHITYGELETLSSMLADRLRSIGVRPNEPVAIILSKGWEQAVAALGVLRAGAYFVPLDSDWPTARLLNVIHDVQPATVIVGRSGRLGVMAETTEIEFTAAMASDVKGGEFAPHLRASQYASPEDIAYAIFTSGSMGIPKGVLISHASAMNTIDDVNERFEVGPRDCVFGLSSLNFDLAIYDLFGSLSAGATLSLPSQETLKEPIAWINRLTTDGVTVWNSVPVLMSLLCDVAQLADKHDWGRSLRLVLLSGDWVPPNLPPVINKFAPKAKVVALGGATEAAIWSILHEVVPDDATRHSIPYGRAMAGQWVAVCDSHLRCRPPLAVGEIVIGGRGVAQGYIGDQELTAGRFPVLAPCGERVYRTGDYGRLLPNGEIEFLGRHDRQVKIAGNRIELSEIESQMVRVAGVERAGVVVVGERNEARLAAFYVGGPEPEELIRALRHRLPAVMVPAHCEKLTEWPLSATGKLDRTQLRRRALNRVRRDEQPLMRGGTTSERLAAIASGLLDGYRPQATEDLVRLGLNSVGVIRLLNAVEREFGVRSRVTDFYANPCLDTLSGLIAGGEARGLSGGEAADSGRPQAAKPPQSLWDQARLEPVTGLSRREFEKTSQRRLPLATPLFDSDIETRRSYRDFSSEPIPIDRFTAMLSCLRSEEREGEPAYYYPSAGGKYAVDIFVAVKAGRVEGVGAGFYYYDPLRNDLIPCVEDIEIHEAINLGKTNPGISRSAAFSLFLVTDPWRTVPIYGDTAEKLAYLNAGYMGQLLSESARAVGLGLCAIDGIDFERIRALFVGGDRYAFVHALYGGIPKREVPFDDRRFRRERMTL